MWERKINNKPLISFSETAVRLNGEQMESLTSRIFFSLVKNVSNLMCASSVSEIDLSTVSNCDQMKA